MTRAETASLPVARPEMRDVLHAEWTKLRTTPGSG
jgi:hypothetical protein